MEAAVIMFYIILRDDSVLIDRNVVDTHNYIHLFSLNGNKSSRGI